MARKCRLLYRSDIQGNSVTVHLLHAFDDVGDTRRAMIGGRRCCGPARYGSHVRLLAVQGTLQTEIAVKSVLESGNRVSPTSSYSDNECTVTETNARDVEAA